MNFKKALTYSFATIIAGVGLSFVTPDFAFAQSAFDDPAPAAEEMTQGGQPGGDFVAVEDDVDGGEVAIGASSKVLVFFRNESQDIISVEDLSLYPSSNIIATVSSNECGESALTPGAECAIILNIQGSQPGSYRVSLLLRHTGIKRLVSANIKGQVVLQAEGAKDQSLSELETSTDSIDFGTVSSTRPIIEALTVKNVSSDPIEIESVSIESSKQSGLSFTHGCNTLQTNQVCLISVKWEPEVEGLSTGFVVIKHSGRNKVKNVTLRGVYQASDAPTASLFPNALPGKGLLISDITEYDFGSDIAHETLLTATLINVGDAPLQFEKIEIAGGTESLEILKRGCLEEDDLAPTQACPIILKWSPEPGQQVLSDALHINHTGTRGLLMLPIQGASDIEETEAPDNVVRRSQSDENAPSGVGMSADEPLLRRDGSVIRPDGTLSAPNPMDELLERLTTDTMLPPLTPPETSQPPIQNTPPPPPQDLPLNPADDGIDMSLPELEEPQELGEDPAPIETVDLPIVPSSKPINPEDLEPVETFSFNDYMISAISNSSAILTSESGSIMVRDGRHTLIDGIRWKVTIKEGGVEFLSDSEKILLLFDDALPVMISE